eukprot:1178252-Prorocentrum_minimum.AAC.2
MAPLWLKKFQHPAVASLIATCETTVYMLNKFDFCRAMALSGGEDLVDMLEHYTNDKRLLCELREGEHWER